MLRINLGSLLENKFGGPARTGHFQCPRDFLKTQQIPFRFSGVSFISYKNCSSLFYSCQSRSTSLFKENDDSESLINYFIVASLYIQ